jgi:hypothetical protein
MNIQQNFKVLFIPATKYPHLFTNAYLSNTQIVTLSLIKVKVW